jgi:hypothetical protein
VTATAALAYHGTLVASTVASVLITGADGTVEVINRSGSAEIYFTVNGVVPTVGGTDCFVVPAAIGSYVVVSSASPTVQLISSGTPTFSVVGAQPV